MRLKGVSSSSFTLCEMKVPVRYLYLSPATHVSCETDSGYMYVETKYRRPRIDFEQMPILQRG